MSKAKTTFAATLRRAITAALASGETYRSIADRAGVHQQQISRWMAGERSIDIVTADKIAAALKVTVEAKR